MCGGLQPRSWPDLWTQPKRLVWASACGAIAFLLTDVWQYSLATAASIFAGSALVGFNGSLTMGHKAGRTYWQDFGWMTVHGLGGTILPAIAAWWWGFNPALLLVAGLACAPAYIAAWQWPWDIEMLGCYPWDPPPTGELLWGFAVGAALVVTSLV